MRETQILRGLHKARATLRMQSGGPDWTTRPGANYNSTSGTQQSFDFGPERNGPQPQTGAAPGLSPEAKAMRDAGFARAEARTAPPMGSTSNATPPPIQEAAPKSAWQQAKQWGGNQWDAARGRPTQGVTATSAAPARPSVVKPMLGGLAAGAMGGAAGYAAAQAAAGIGDPSNNPVRPNPTENAQVLKIPGQSSVAPAPQPYNYFTDNEAGRNIGNTLNAVSMTGGAGPLARGALGMGTGAISKTLKLAERPLVAGAVQGAAQGVRDVNIESAAPTQTAAQSKAVDVAPVQAAAPTVVPAPTANGRQYLPGAVTAEDHAQSDKLINQAFGNLRKTGTDEGTNQRMNALRTNDGSLDKFNQGIAMRGSGIKASRDANGGLVLSNSTAPEKMPYVDTEGAPTTDYKKTQQFAESSAGLRAQPPMNLAWRTQLANERRDAAKIALDERRLTHEMRQSAAKGVNDDAMLSPHATVVDQKTGERKVSEAAANDLRQFRQASAGRMVTPDGKPVALEQLRATNPTEYQRMITASDTAFGLGRLFNKYAKDTTFGAQTGWGMPKISDMREASMKDWFKGMSASDAALAPFKPGYYSQGVEIDLGGRKQMVPIGELLNDEVNGGQYREMLNEWRKAHKLPLLGNAVTGE